MEDEIVCKLGGEVCDKFACCKRLISTVVVVWLANSDECFSGRDTQIEFWVWHLFPKNAQLEFDIEQWLFVQF